MSIGEGGTSEGEFWESLNTACNAKAPVLFLVEDNGYAISVPVETQTPGGDISRIVSGFPGLQVYHCDGTDYVASYRTLEDAIGHVRAGQGPALVHATVTRPYSHSHSDDERLYKPAAEREAEARRDPLVRMRTLLIEEGHRDGGRAGRDARHGRARGRRRRRLGARGAQAGSGNRVTVRLLARRRSDVLAVRSRPADRRAAGHDARRPSTRR